MKANTLLKYGIPILLVVVVFFLVSYRSGKKDEPVESSLSVGETIKIPKKEAVDLLGVEADTPKDTMATLIAQYKDVSRDLKGLSEQNAKLMAENDRYRKNEERLEKQIADKIDEGVKRALDRAQAEGREVSPPSQHLSPIAEWNRRLGTVAGGNATEASGDNDQGLIEGEGLFNFSFGEEGLKKNKNGNANGNNGNRRSDQTATNSVKSDAGQGLRVPADPQMLVWIEPLDTIALDPKTGKPVVGPTLFPTVFESLGSGVTGIADKIEEDKQKLPMQRGVKRREDEVKPVYTIARNSTLIGSIAMTALIGRIPVEGSVTDPYPFKVLIGKDNLAANGFDLPYVDSAVMSGTAVGDWTLSCVRGQVESVTFIFEDGTIRTLPIPEEAIKSGGSNATKAAIGYLSDSFGVPCVLGERKSNAQEYLTTQTLLTAAGAGAAYKLARDSTQVVDTAGNTIISDKNAAVNQILTGGVADVRGWFAKLYGTAYAAIYVPPQAEVAVHIEQELKIDFEPHGRKVVHQTAQETRGGLE